MDGWMCESIDGQKDRWMNVLMVNKPMKRAGWDITTLVKKDIHNSLEGSIQAYLMKTTTVIK